MLNVDSDLTNTCLVPTDAADPPAKLESSYTFATECFFMTHYTLSLGFRVLHERLVQLNRELHRIQEVYRDVSQQAAADAEPTQRLKEDMERGRYCARYPHMPTCGYIVDCLFVCVCDFVWLRISPSRIKLAASIFAWWFIGVLGRESHFGGLCSSRSPKSDESSSTWATRAGPRAG